ncbi:MAG: DNA polymerase I, partial [Planctomycetales bacterium]|nr:DNA polymerase I [Planctomycetales bacterium]
MSPNSEWTVYLVDAHSLIFQVFHAIPEMTSPQGEPVNAVYGFTRDLLYLLLEKRPTGVVCAFDPPGDTFRHALYEAYKGDRGEMPEELRTQIPKIQAVVAALGIPLVSVPNFEADDVLATLSRECDEAGTRCLVVTGDKDCRQLITKNVSIYNIRKDDVYDATSLFADWAIAPEQVVDFQALVGDKIDNVPGVPLIGPKTASTLLTELGSLEAVLDNPDKARGKKTQENLRNHREQALLSRKLVRLDQHVPLGFDWSSSTLGQHDASKLADLFGEFGFRSLAEKAAELDGETPQAEEWQGDYRVVPSLEELQELVDGLRHAELLSIDTETTAINPRVAELVGVSLAAEPGAAYYVPLRGPQGDTVLEPQAALALLRPLLEDPAVPKLGQNLKYDAVVLRSAGIELRGIRFDTMVASYLLDAGQRNHNLDDLAQRYLNYTTTKISALIGTGKNQKRMDEVPLADVSPYACEDVDVPLRLQPMLEKELEAKNLDELFRETELPLIDVLVEMESNGILVDKERLEELSKEYGARLDKLEQEIYELA